MALDTDSCWRAFSSRDRRFEGRFVAGVTSTGIYCRPGCPAKLPRRTNLRFFVCAAAAEEDGFRPCLRCRPDAVPGSPAWLGATTTVRRALRLIADGALDDAGVDALAGRLGVTDRHLRRLFHEHLGASPQSIAHTRRVHFARRLIDETRLPMTEVALGAGFASLRRFNHAIKDTFRRAPRDLRRDGVRRNGASAGDDANAVVLRVPVREPFDWAGLLAFLRGRAVPGVESADERAYRRAFELRVPDAAPVFGTLEVSRPTSAALELRVHMAEPRELISIVERVTRVFDAAADADAIARHLKRDATLAPVLARMRGLRVPGAWDPFELAVRAVLGQQVTVAGARTLAGRLAHAYGTPLGAAARGDLTHAFPTAASLAGAELERHGLTRARASTLRALADAVATGRLRLDAFADLDDAVAQLVALPGIGPWTAHYVAMRALGEPDAFPASDLGVRKALARRGKLPGEREAIARAEAWRPWRAYAVMALWRSEVPATRRKETS